MIEANTKIINGNQYYNSLILVIRHKFGFSLQLYSDVVIKKYIACYLPRIVCNHCIYA